MTQNRTLSLILPAFGAAIIAALAQIIIPIGAVPITLQTFAVGLVAAILKPKEATLAATLYLILGAIGLPVFAGGGGGLQAFFGPSTGYLLAYPFFALVTSKLTHAETPIWKIFVAFVLGDALVFVGGILSLHFLGKMGWSAAVAVGLTPFIIPDLLKGLIVALVTKPVLKALKNQSYFNYKKIEDFVRVNRIFNLFIFQNKYHSALNKLG